MRKVACGIFWLGGTATARGHEIGESAAAVWTSEAALVAFLAVLLLMYLIGLARIWRKVGFAHGIRPRQVALFAAGYAGLVAAFSPLQALGGSTFTAHMIEHQILTLVAAPLLVAAMPMGALMWSLTPRLRLWVADLTRLRAARRSWATLTSPLIAMLIQAAALWLWHVPKYFHAALELPWVHGLQHFCFLVTALLFWQAVLRPRHDRIGAAILGLFLTVLHSGLLGALITFAGQPLYPLQSRDAGRWGLTLIEDQQIAGLIMWIPPGLIYTAMALALAALWLKRAGNPAWDFADTVRRHQPWPGG